ncbi:hypothetical protein [Anaeromyxobacter terrae]|uniref:hypothetical protein n=1 Tax=Anaeromyxobacter terrae TaxID=2925406 RepID=UPI001F5AFD1E|nr:hypothetical protein [Anaeromyxobacter sp. SG22]
MRTIALGTVSLMLLSACTPDAGLGTPPVNAEVHPLAGSYQVVSQFSVPAAAAAPGPLGDALGLVHGLAVNPAGALLDLAEDAGVPALGTIRSVLPDALQGELEGWMNAFLETATVGGSTPHDDLVALDALIRSVLLDWELRSELELLTPAPGRHTPKAIAFHATGEPLVIPVDATAPVAAATGVYANVSWVEGQDGPAKLSVGDHAMGVPFGRYARQALAILLEAQYGVPDVRAVLAGAVDCAAMAESVGARCVGFVCVGHETELAAVCEGGLDEAAAQVEARILALDYKAIHLQAGTATAEGVAVDPASEIATAERFAGGVWTASVDLGQGEEEASATFVAAR